ncbi:MAG TPA: hypothetical protein VIJ64_08855 [Candidatus Lustribacter sp.]
MTNKSRGAAVALGLALLWGPASAQPSATQGPTPAPAAFVAPSSLLPGRARDLYSAHARRLVRAYLRLQLLELRKADLDRVRAVIEGKLGMDALFAPPAQAGRRAPSR